MKSTIKSALTALILLIIISFSANAQKSNPDDILGLWMTGTGSGIVEIYKKDNKYFGKIVWLKEPNDEKGKPKTDQNNPEQKLRSQPILGLVNLKNFKSAGNNKWEDGKIYDPSNGKEYSCEMTLTDPKTLEVRGYVGFTWIGRTDVWQKQTKLP